MATATVTSIELPAAPWRPSTVCADRESIALRELCALLGAPAASVRDLPEERFALRHLKTGETLHLAGDRFDAIYVVRSGSLKAASIDYAGDEQVLAFPMSGDVLGLDGLEAERYTSEVVALEAAELVVVPFARLVLLGRAHACVARLLYAAFSQELVRKRRLMWLLGRRDAEARVAAFLLELSERFGRLGHSRASLALRMSRRHIGSYLGIRLETVSRAFSAFAAAGWLTVERAGVTLRDVAALRQVAGEQDGPGSRAGRELPLTPLNERVRQRRIVGIAERRAYALQEPGVQEGAERCGSTSGRAASR